MSKFAGNGSLKLLKRGLASRQNALNAVPRKYTHNDAFKRLSTIYVPTGGLTASATAKDESLSLLVRAGFIRQAHAGVFHLLPLGLRVQEKLEHLIDQHMSKLGAGKLSLSSLTTKELWTRSGRLAKAGGELYQLNDGNDTGFLLSPTHEEEITTLVANTLHSYKQLPIRLYQMSRKYRNERRPRQGLLRAREFLMKDLYTFDVDEATALQTYQQVKAAYYDFFNELKIPYLVAEADSGAMGGNLSHEFHFATPAGEDTVFSCDKCTYVANEELAEHASEVSNGGNIDDGKVWTCLTHDKKTLVAAFCPGGPTELNLHVLKKLVPDTNLSVEPTGQAWRNAFQYEFQGSNVVALLDHRLSDAQKETVYSRVDDLTSGKLVTVKYIHATEDTGRPLDLIRVKAGDRCPRCGEGQLQSQKAVELGHTFHLGTRYSEPLKALVSVPNTPSSRNLETGDSKEADLTPVSMGCHGIGVSRLIGTVAAMLADEKGLNWPRAIAPFEAVVVAGNGLEQDAEDVARALCITDARPIDALLDDREHDLGWKLHDADLIGYPVVIVVGRAWKQGRGCEVQCRRLDNFRKDVPFEHLQRTVGSLLDRL